MCTQNTGNAGRKPKQHRCWKFRCYYWIQNILRSLHSVNCSLLTKVICCDPRLKSFLKSATEKKKYRSKNDKESPLSNIFENILKARTSKFFSAFKLKEHLITSLQGRIMTWVILCLRCSRKQTHCWKYN